MMRQVAWVAVILWLFGAISLAGAAEASDLPAIELVAGESTDDLKSQVRFARAEHDGPPRPADLLSLNVVDHTSLQFGRVGQPVYVFLMLRNSGPAPGNWILSTGRSTISDFVLYRKEGAGWRTVLDGDDSVQQAATLYQYQAYASEIGLAPGEEALYAIRFQDEVSSWMPLRIDTFGDFFTARRSNIAMVAGVVAGSLILALFNVILLAGTGRRVFVWLGLAEAAFAFNTLHAEGYSSILWLYRYPDLQSVFGEFSRVLFGLLMLQFGREFLDTRSELPRSDLFLRAAIALGTLVILAASIHLVMPFESLMPLHALGWIFTLVSALSLPFIGWVATRRYGMQFLPLLVGWSALGIYIAFTAVAISGLIPKLAVNWHWVGPIGLFECVMATLAVGLHLRKLHHERLAAERTARQELLARIAISEEAGRLAEERAKALASLQARDRLIEMSAHDTRHVLHALNSAVHLGRQTGGDLPRRDLMTLIEASARHLEEIVGSSVTIDNGSGRFLALGLVDVERLLDDIVTIYAAASRDGNVVINRKCAQGMRVVADEALLARVLSNLVNNALRATSTGRIEISCDVQEDVLALSVTDTGSGMAPAIAEYLVGEFDGSECAVMPAGLGKGWRAIREILSLLHGSYTVETGPGGTAVTVCLPLSGEGEEFISLDQLKREYPGFYFIEEENLSDSEIGDRRVRMGSGQVPVFVGNRATPETRVRSASLGDLLLLRPLVRGMMDHPYVEELTTSRAARAQSIS